MSLLGENKKNKICLKFVLITLKMCLHVYSAGKH